MKLHWGAMFIKSQFEFEELNPIGSIGARSSARQVCLFARCAGTCVISGGDLFLLIAAE